MFKNNLDEDCLADFVTDQSSFPIKDQQSVFTKVEGPGIAEPSSRINGTHLSMMYAGPSQAWLRPPHQGLPGAPPDSHSLPSPCSSLPDSPSPSSPSHSPHSLRNTSCKPLRHEPPCLCTWLYPTGKKSVYGNVFDLFLVLSSRLLFNPTSSISNDDHVDDNDNGYNLLGTDCVAGSVFCILHTVACVILPTTL